MGIVDAIETANLQYRFDIQLPSYVITNANFSVTYVFVLMDGTALLRDFPKYKLATVMIIENARDRVVLSLAEDIFQDDYNIFLGIG